MAATKIVATVGPSCDTVPKMMELINEGVSVFRFNLKHNTQKWHSIRIKRVEEAQKELDKPIAALLDFQGPEVRIGVLKDEKLHLTKGDEVYFVSELGLTKQQEIPLNNIELLKKLDKGTTILLDGGAFEFQVMQNQENRVLTKVLRGGTLTQRKSVNIPGVELDLPTLVAKDIEDIGLAAREDVDYVALSYVRTAKDIEIFKQELKKQNVDADIIAKIETRKSIENLDQIIEVSDGIMVARGDLGVEFPLEQVPYYQKEIIKKCLKVGKPVITATQMLESMVREPRPTRAEISDVANAIYDRSDALMLSAESAVGAYPERAVGMMRQISEFTEKNVSGQPEINYHMKHQTAAVTFGAYQFMQSDFCQRENIKAFVVLTETGLSARMLSRLRPSIPIIALTRHKKTADKMNLLYGVTPIVYKQLSQTYEKKESEHIRQMILAVKKKGLVKADEKVIMVYGEDWGSAGKTSIVRIQEVN